MTRGCPSDRVARVSGVVLLLLVHLRLWEQMLVPVPSRGSHRIPVVNLLGRPTRRTPGSDRPGLLAHGRARSTSPTGGRRLLPRVCTRSADHVSAVVGWDGCLGWPSCLRALWIALGLARRGPPGRTRRGLERHGAQRRRLGLIRFPSVSSRGGESISLELTRVQKSGASGD